MPDAFVPLAVGLCNRSAASPDAPVEAAAAASDAPCTCAPGEIALLRVAVREAFEHAAAALLEELAREVLARELLLAPPDIEALVAAAVDAYAGYEPAKLVLAPVDAAGARTALPVRADPALGPGDVVVEVRDGAFESRFDLRVAAVVERAAAEVARAG